MLPSRADVDQALGGDAAAELVRGVAVVAMIAVGREPERVSASPQISALAA